MPHEGRRGAKVVPFRKKEVARTSDHASIIDVNASSSWRQPALDEAALRRAVLRVMKHGTWWQSRHARDDRDYRHISDDDIQAMLEGEWKLEREPEWDDRHGEWKYRLGGKDVEGDALTLIITLNEETITIIVVTKF